MMENPESLGDLGVDLPIQGSNPRDSAQSRQRCLNQELIAQTVLRLAILTCYELGLFGWLWQ